MQKVTQRDANGAVVERRFDTLAEYLAGKVQARVNCLRNGNMEWEQRHFRDVQTAVENYMPHGSGFDMGVGLDWQKSHAARLVFFTSYHHMDEGGGYDGWSDHAVTIVPLFGGDFDVRVGGRDRNSIKDYIAEMFAEALRTPILETAAGISTWRRLTLEEEGR